jgi:hypothetical protein
MDPADMHGGAKKIAPTGPKREFIHRKTRLFRAEVVGVKLEAAAIDFESSEHRDLEAGKLDARVETRGKRLDDPGSEDRFRTMEIDRDDGKCRGKE